jgi:hypothetical protein
MTSEIMLADRGFPIRWDKVVLWKDSKWDARQTTCIVVDVPDRARAWRRKPTDWSTEHFDISQCSPDGTPYGNGVHDTRSRLRYSERPGCAGLWSKPESLLETVQRLVRQVVVHHDGCTSSAMCFHVLHNERGLSCHFLIDNDGTIYQTLDLAYAAWHAASHNHISVGIELCSRGNRNLAAEDAWGRRPKQCTIHGLHMEAWGYSEEQLEAIVALGQALRKALPGVPVAFPRMSDSVLSMPLRSSQDGQAWGLLAKPFTFSGWLGHYHTTTGKWDPGPFDFQELCHKIGGAVFLPLALPRTGSRSSEQAAVAISQDAAERATQLELLYDSNAAAKCGAFPTGPYCEYKLWHGGVHLSADKGAIVHAVLPGRIVAARSGPADNSFVLLRHNVLGTHREFYSLYFHLAKDMRGANPAARWPRAVRDNPRNPEAITLLDEPIAGGDAIGSVDPAGPDSVPQLHYEIFAIDRIDDDLVLVEDPARDRFCDDRNVIASPGDPARFRDRVVRSCSEWSARCGGNDWVSALTARPTELTRRDVDALVKQQITPAIWWTEDVATAIGLPRDAYVYHYHPIGFLDWISAQLSVRATPSNVAAVAPTDVAPTDDFDEHGQHALDEADAERQLDCRQGLDIERVVEGYNSANSECWPRSAE